jgi:glycerol-3-phosphate dehydrogenase
MKRDLPALAAGKFDVLIIGGGITGAGIARDAALRGLRVALVDQGDFASGTSSKSSKLIHGGFRYLEQGAFHLVAEACRERAILRRIAPHLVGPLPFLFPVYAGDLRPKWKMRIGMTLYDLLALYKNVERHRTLSASSALSLEPNLSGDHLRGAIRYFDCSEDDARFCVENILHAASLGAVCANYCRVATLNRTGDRVTSVRLQDRIGSGEFEATPKVIVNAAGPWVDRIAPSDFRLGPTKGVHLLLPRLTREHAIAFQAQRDGRILFIIPWHDGSLVGTTDTDFHADPADAAADAADVAYLLEEAGRVLRLSLSTRDIVTTFAGVRPLLSPEGSPSARSREHRIIRQAANLLAVAGGKYTTYRAVAEQAVDQIFDMLGRRSPACPTATTPLPPPQQSGSPICDNPRVTDADIARACREEMAHSVSDVMWRRTGLALTARAGELAPVVGRLMAKELQWSAQIEAESIADFLEEWSRAASLPHQQKCRNDGEPTPPSGVGFTGP